MLISFESPDYAADLSVGKKTLTFRLGLRGSAWAMDAFIGCAFLFLAVLSLSTNFPGWWMIFAVPLAIWQMITIHRVILTPTRTYNLLVTTGGVGLFVLTALLALLGFIFAV